MTVLGPGQSTPAPWINVIANPTFGFQTGTEGGGYTWSINSRENQITPWSNDPVSDRPGEAFYVRDDDTGDFWTPTALPIRDAAGTYVARHGRGYSRFEHVANEIASDLLQYVPIDDSVKISRLVLTNRSSRPRRLSVFAYAEWVLGPSRPAIAAVCFDRNRRLHRRDVRPQSLEYELWFASRLRRSVRGSDQLDRQSARIHRPKRRARRPRRPFQRCGALRDGWSGPGSLRGFGRHD